MREPSWGWLLLVAVGCGPGTASGGSEGSGGESTGFSTSETGTAEAGEDEGEPADCSEFDDAAATGPGVAVFIHNQTGTPIFLGGNWECGAQYVHIESVNGVFPNPGCDTCQGEGACASCPKLCPSPPLVRVEPDGYLEIGWDGVVYEPITLAPECAPEDCEQLECRAEREAEDGPVVVTAYRFDETVCPDPDEESCQCQPGPTGACTPDAFANEFAEVIQAQGELIYGPDDDVVVAFE